MALGIFQRLYAILETLYQDVPFGILHRSQQLGQHQSGIARPIPIVSTVKFAACSIHGHGGGNHAAGTKSKLGGTRLMYRPIADQPNAASKDVLVFANDLFQVNGACFFLPFDDELQIGGGLLPTGFEGIERCHECRDWSFVVSSRSCIDSPLWIERLPGCRERNNLAVFFDRS